MILLSKNKYCKNPKLGGMWMGKSILSTVRFAEFAIRLSSENPSRPTTPPRNKVFVKKARETKLHHGNSNLVKLEKAGSHSGSNPAPPGSDPTRVPLAQVVEDCVRRWFQDTLKEAKSGDVGMQVLVGQMYCSGYGIPKDEHKVLSFSGFSIGFVSNWCGFSLVLAILSESFVLGDLIFFVSKCTFLFASWLVAEMQLFCWLGILFVFVWWKGRAWINKASRTRSSAWQVSDKPPGKN